MNAKTMKRKPNRRSGEVMRNEYDFSDGVRGKYYRNYLKSTSVVTLDQDVSVRFRTSAALNQALRTLMQTELLIRSLAKRPPRARRATAAE